jgi:hypothetical protein
MNQDVKGYDSFARPLSVASDFFACCAAQQPQQPPEKTPGLQVDVSRVLVPVVVRDAQGHAVGNENDLFRRRI